MDANIGTIVTVAVATVLIVSGGTSEANTLKIDSDRVPGLGSFSQADRSSTALPMANRSSKDWAKFLVEICESSLSKGRMAEWVVKDLQELVAGARVHSASFGDENVLLTWDFGRYHFDFEIDGSKDIEWFYFDRETGESDEGRTWYSGSVYRRQLLDAPAIHSGVVESFSIAFGRETPSLMSL